MKNKLFVILLCGAILLSLASCSKSNLEEAKKDLEESYEKYGSVLEENVDVLVAKFNTEVVDNSSLNPASNDYLTESNNQYWYGLIEGIYLVVVPKEYTGDRNTDIVDHMLIYVNKTSKYENDAIAYAKYLIKANYNEVTEEETTSLLEEAKTKSTTGKTAYNGKGIAVGYLDNSDNYQYQVLRFYK